MTATTTAPSPHPVPAPPTKQPATQHPLKAESRRFDAAPAHQYKQSGDQAERRPPPLSDLYEVITL
jgi:hypothetical protein